jgi:PhzF family phenazine biosynthesis protein
MPVPILHVDAFTTDHPFSGNPAGVCLLDTPAPESWMAAVAAELNLPETAFVWPAGGAARFGLRWWSPRAEIPLCGHATLATGFALAVASCVDPAATLTFETASGELTTRPEGNLIELDFPAYDRRDLDADETAALIAALGRDADGAAGYGPKALLALPDVDAVLAATPDFAALAALPYEGLLVTAPTDGGFVLRFFAPAVGIDEDPVTGSAQCAAAPYWQSQHGGTEWNVEQLSARRGHLRVRADGGGRVRIAGRAALVHSGTLVVEEGLSLP